MAIEDKQAETIEQYEKVITLMTHDQIKQVEDLLEDFGVVYEDENSTVEDCEEVLDSIKEILNNII